MTSKRAFPSPSAVFPDVSPARQTPGVCTPKPLPPPNPTSWPLIGLRPSRRRPRTRQWEIPVPGLVATHPPQPWHDALALQHFMWWQISPCAGKAVEGTSFSQKNCTSLGAGVLWMGRGLRSWSIHGLGTTSKFWKPKKCQNQINTVYLLWFPVMCT